VATVGTVAAIAMLPLLRRLSAPAQGASGTMATP
jgi:hypothetical protein